MGTLYSAWSGEKATGTALKTFIQIVAPSTMDIVVREIYAGQKRAPSNTADTPVLLTVMRQTTAGTPGAGSASLTPRELGPQSGRAANFTGVDAPTAAWTGEPTAGDHMIHRYFPVAQGYTWQGFILVPRSGRLGICLTSATDITCLAEVIVEEG